MVVQPGDVVVGDEDGVVAFPPALAEDLIRAVRQQEAKRRRSSRASAREPTRAPTPSRLTQEERSFGQILADLMLLRRYIH